MSDDEIYSPEEAQRRMDAAVRAMFAMPREQLKRYQKARKRDRDYTKLLRDKRKIREFIDNARAQAKNDKTCG